MTDLIKPEPINGGAITNDRSDNTIDLDDNDSINNDTDNESVNSSSMTNHSESPKPQQSPAPAQNGENTTISGNRGFHVG